MHQRNRTSVTIATGLLFALLPGPLCAAPPQERTDRADGKTTGEAAALRTPSYVLGPDDVIGLLLLAPLKHFVDI